jgi:hypothetical protein
MKFDPTPISFADHLPRRQRGRELGAFPLPHEVEERWRA